MFEWRFRITPGIIPLPFLETAFFAGWGRVPRPTHTTVQDNELVIRTETYGSGTVHVPMMHPPLGVVIESTESLLGRHERYLLLKELVRGALGRFYRRLFDWQMLGFQHPEELEERLNRLAKRFSAVVTQDPFLPHIERECAAILDELALLFLDENREVAEQSLSWRTRNDARLPITLGVGMDARYLETPHECGFYAALLQDSLHALLPMPTWRNLEPQPGQFDWERLEKQLSMPSRFGLQLILGPLLSFCAESFPDWLLSHLSEEGYFESRATRFVNAMAERYGYLTQTWILANRFGDHALPEMPPERSMALIRMLAQQLRSRGITAPLLVGITQPWGEYALRRMPEWELVQIAETLMGCRDIDAFLLEMDFGAGNYQTLPRSPICVGNMIDQWSYLGKKLYISFSVPSTGFPLVTESLVTGAMVTGTDTTTSELLSEMRWTEERQRLWTETLLSTFLSKRTVRGIFWSCLHDSVTVSDSTAECDNGLINASHINADSINAGRLNAEQTFKPAFKHFTAARKNLLR